MCLSVFGYHPPCIPSDALTSIGLESVEENLILGRSERVRILEGEISSVREEKLTHDVAAGRLEPS